MAVHAPCTRMRPAGKAQRTKDWQLDRGTGMLWNSWEGVLKILVVGIGSYIGLLLIQRVSGKRTLSKLNAFDLVVTVALGSTLATTMLSPDVSLVGGLAGIALLILLQLTVTFMSVRVPAFRRLVKASPTLLVENGRMLRDAMRHERVTEDEVLQAIRSTGKASLDGIYVVLETNGKLSVVQHTGGETTTIADLLQRSSE